MKTSVALCLGGLLAFCGSGPAAAQRSLFGAPTEDAPAAAPAAPAPRAKPRPARAKGPVPARSLQINNATSNTLASLEVSGEGKSAQLAKPLAPKKKATLKLPTLKSCAVSVTSTFEGGQPDTNDFDICKEKSIRFTE